MNKAELGQRFSDFMRGPKVDGTVAAILNPQISLSQRYAVRTDSGIVDAHIFVQNGIYGPLREQLSVGDRLETRAIKAEPWIDGQRI